MAFEAVLRVLEERPEEEMQGEEEGHVVDLERLSDALSSFNETASALASMYAGRSVLYILEGRQSPRPPLPMS